MMRAELAPLHATQTLVKVYEVDEENCVTDVRWTMVLSIAFMGNYKARGSHGVLLSHFLSLTSHDKMIFLEPSLFKKGIMIMSASLEVIVDYCSLFDDVVDFDVSAGHGDRQSGAGHGMCLGGVASSVKRDLLEATSMCIMKATFMAMMGSNVISQ